MSKADRGFASMGKEKQRRIASLGGKAAHAEGKKGHEWTPEEARIAGHKGGKAMHKKAAAAQSPSTDDHDVSRFSDEGNPHG
jgi:uncharacterized protein